MSKSDKEWKQRRLCSDGNCIGIIGTDGRCKECGLPYDGALPAFADDSHASDDGMDDLPPGQPISGKDDRSAGDVAPVSGASDDTWENRTLCIDESCIGVVGPDGRCKECGTPHPGSQP